MRVADTIMVLMRWWRNSFTRARLFYLRDQLYFWVVRQTRCRVRGHRVKMDSHGLCINCCQDVGRGYRP